MSKTHIFISLVLKFLMVFELFKGIFMKRLILILCLFASYSNSEIIAITSDELPSYVGGVEVTFNTLKIGESAFQLITSIKNISDRDITFDASTLHLDSHPLESNLLLFFDFPPDFSKESLKIKKDGLYFKQLAAQPATLENLDEYPSLELPPGSMIFVREPLTQYYDLQPEKIYYFLTDISFQISDTEKVEIDYGVKLQLSQANRIENLLDLHPLESEPIYVDVKNKSKDIIYTWEK